MLISDYLNYYSRNTPGMKCLTVDGKTSSYEDVNILSNKVANGLLELGVSKGERIAILGENSLKHLIVFFAAARIGAVAVSLNYRLAPRELAYIITDAQAKFLFTTSEQEDVLGALKPLLNENVTYIAESDNGHDDFDAWIAKQSSDAIEGIEIKPDDPFLQLYTSGTTGNPKGVVSSQGNIVNVSRMNEAAMPVRPNQGEATIVCAPLFHVGGVASLFISLYHGMHTLLHKSFDPEKVVTGIESYVISNMFMVPAMIMAIINMPGIEKRNFNNLGLVFYGASPISETDLRKAIEVFDCEFIQLYGMTETTGAATNLVPQDHKKALNGAPHILRSCGRAAVGVTIKIAAPDGQEMPCGEVGEIWINSPTNMLHYYNLNEATKKNLTNGWVHTGDAGYTDEDGYIYLKDRIKDMVVSGAENIYPVEVENVLAQHASIKDVAVIGVPNEKLGEALLAFVVLNEGASLETDEMIAFCRGKIGGYKIPRQMEVLNELPRNPSGKILKKVLRAPYWEGKGRQIG